MANLRPVQEEAADFIFGQDKSLILAPVGSGKTAIALTAMAEYVSQGLVKRWLVIAPKLVCTDVWPIEVKLWAPSLTLYVAAGGKDFRSNAIASKADIVCINFDVLQRLAAEFPDLSLYFDGVVIDELSRLKVAGDTRSRKESVKKKGKRFVAAYKALENVHIRIGMTGSFTSNGLEDVFGQVKMIDYKIFGATKSRFLADYFVCINRTYGDYAPKVGALEKVMNKLKPTAFVLEGRSNQHECHIIEMRCDIVNRKPYDDMKRDFVVQFPTAKIAAMNSGVVTGKLKQLATGFCYETRTVPNPDWPGKSITTQVAHWYDTSKFDLLDSILTENHHEPTIIVYWYKEQLAELKRRYPDAQTLDDDGAISRWNAGKISKLLLHPRGGGHGVNLQFSGRMMVFLTLPYYSAELYEQVIGRIDRSGQTRDVYIYVLFANKTVDDLEWDAINGKLDFSDVAAKALS